MTKAGIYIEVPGFGQLAFRTIVSDYTGTLSCKGKLIPGVKERLLELQKRVDILIATSDSYGTVCQKRITLGGIPTIQKEILRKRVALQLRVSSRRSRAFTARHL